MSRLITVFEATGVKEGSVVRVLLEQGNFKVRGITRDVESKKAKEIASQGVEMVQASLDDPESCKKAIKGSYGVFLVTNYWDAGSGKKETDQGKVVVDICVEVGVKHLVYRGSESAEKMCGRVIDHIDSKARVEEYMASKEGDMKWCSVRMSPDFNNFLNGWKPEKKPDGSFILALPMEGKPMYGMDVSDFGACVAGVFNEPEKYSGKMIGLAAEYLTIEQYAAILSKVLAPRVVKDAKQVIDKNAKDSFGGSQVVFLQYQGGIERDIELTRKLNPNLSSFEDFVTKHKKVFESFM